MKYMITKGCEQGSKSDLKIEIRLFRLNFRLILILGENLGEKGKT